MLFFKPFPSDNHNNNEERVRGKVWSTHLSPLICSATSISYSKKNAHTQPLNRIKAGIWSFREECRILIKDFFFFSFTCQHSRLSTLLRLSSFIPLPYSPVLHWLLSVHLLVLTSVFFMLHFSLFIPISFMRETLGRVDGWSYSTARSRFFRCEKEVLLTARSGWAVSLVEAVA